jgi:hypothetical protein
MIGGTAAPGIIRAGWSWPPVSPPPGEATRAPRREHAIVSLRRRQLRILRGIERDIADSDPGLEALYLGFARRTGGHDLRWVERIDVKRWRWLFFRPRQEADPGEPMKDRSAENWNDP